MLTRRATVALSMFAVASLALACGVENPSNQTSSAATGGAGVGGAGVGGAGVGGAGTGGLPQCSLGGPLNLYGCLLPPATSSAQGELTVTGTVVSVTATSGDSACNGKDNARVIGEASSASSTEVVIEDANAELFSLQFQVPGFDGSSVAVGDSLDVTGHQYFDSWIYLQSMGRIVVERNGSIVVAVGLNEQPFAFTSVPECTYTSLCSPEYSSIVAEVEGQSGPVPPHSTAVVGSHLVTNAENQRATSGAGGDGCATDGYLVAAAAVP